MLIVTINEVPGKKIEALGVVRGSTVQSRNLGHDIMAGFRTLVGGEVTDYAEMLTEARQIAHDEQHQGRKQPCPHQCTPDPFCFPVCLHSASKGTCQPQ